MAKAKRDPLDQLLEAAKRFAAAKADAKAYCMARATGRIRTPLRNCLPRKLEHRLVVADAHLEVAAMAWAESLPA